MWRLGFSAVIVIAALVVSVALVMTRPADGGDATTDHAIDEASENVPAPRTFTPVPLDAPAEGGAAPRHSSDPQLDTGSAAHVDEAWI